MYIPINWLKEYIDLTKSPKELAESFTAIGLLLDKPFDKTVDEPVLDLEHRMDRSDWLSILGCARDLAAFESIELKYPQLYKKEGKPNGGIDIKVEATDVVHRFNTRVFKGVKVGPSPDWLKNRLESYGIPSKNNIVDITNYVMVELGQPMHAQDIDKMEKPEIVIRMAKEGEKITTLLGEEVTLDSSMFVLTQNDKPTVIGGIVGGNSTGVTEETTNIVLDAGNYDQTNIRKTSRKLKIQNETVLRYDKFLHPELTQLAIERATYLILELAGGEYYENEDYYPQKWDLKEQRVRYSRIKKIGGLDFEPSRVKQILESLEYKIISEDDEGLLCQVPFFRTDVEVEDDLVADVLRISDYNKIPIVPIQSAPPKEITPKIYKFEQKVKQSLVELGLHEHITDPLVEAEESNTNQVKLQNALTSEKSALRTNILDTLGKVQEYYKKHKISEIELFEIGLEYAVYGDNDDIESFTENRTLAIMYSCEGLGVRANSKKVKQIFLNLLKKLEIKVNGFEYEEGNEGVKVSYQNEQVAMLNAYSIKIDLKSLMNLPTEKSWVKSEIPNYSYEDITVEANITKKLGNNVSKAKKLSDDIIEIEVKDEYLVNETTKAITFKVIFLDSKAAQSLRDKVSEVLKS